MPARTCSRQCIPQAGPPAIYTLSEHMADEYSAERCSGHIRVDDFDIFVEIDGSGPYMILTHGLGANTNIFLPLVDIFRHRYTCVRIDWPGMGLSSLSKKHKLGIPILLAILVSVMEHLSITGAILVGHDVGAVVSMMLAATHPELVQGLAVMGGGRANATPSGSKALLQALADLVRRLGSTVHLDDRVAYYTSQNAPPLARALLRALTSQVNPEGYAQMCEALCADSHVDPDYSKIICPTCVIGGIADTVSPVSVAEELIALIGSGGRLPSKHILATGHMMMIEDVEGTAAALSSMLVEIDCQD